MLDKDKLYIVHYIDVSQLDPVDVPEFLARFCESMKYDESVRPFFIPVIGESHSWVEILNPRPATEEDIEKFDGLIKDGIKWE